MGNIDRTKGKVYKVEKIIAHNEYNRKGFKEMDIAVMKIKGPIVFNTNAQPICLPSKSFESPRGTTLVAAGWGFLAYQAGYTPTLLQQVVLNVIPIEKCAEIYDRIRYKNFKHQICTHNLGKDACQGDSGGPLVDLVNGRGFLVGIVSYGVTCAGIF